MDQVAPHGPGDLITSPANPSIKLARSLHRRRVRHRERAMLVEGTRAIEAAVDLDVRIRTLFIDAARLDDVDAYLLNRLRGVAARILLVDPPLFRQITDTEHAQPLVAICDLVDLNLPADSTFVVALDAVRDPGNLGTVIRSCAAAGVDGVALLPGCVDPYNPKAVRASAGAIFAIPVRAFPEVDEIVRRCFVDRPQTVVAAAESDLAYDDTNWCVPSLVIIGGEAKGAGRDVRTYADFSVKIPMAPGVESLNAAVAAAILVFEVARQRRSR